MFAFGFSFVMVILGEVQMDIFCAAAETLDPILKISEVKIWCKGNQIPYLTLLNELQSYLWSRILWNMRHYITSVT